MHDLASFDRRLIAARASLQPSRPARARPAAPAAARQLISPQGDAVAAINHQASDAAILRAAHGIAAGDWLGLLADEAGGRGLAQCWRLALWRAGSKGSSGPHWLSAGLAARPGHDAAALQRAALAQAVRALWAQGWRLVDVHPQQAIDR